MKNKIMVCLLIVIVAALGLTTGTAYSQATYSEEIRYIYWISSPKDLPGFRDYLTYRGGFQVGGDKHLGPALHNIMEGENVVVEVEGRLMREGRKIARIVRNPKEPFATILFQDGGNEMVLFSPEVGGGITGLYTGLSHKEIGPKRSKGIKKVKATKDPWIVEVVYSDDRKVMVGVK